MCCLIRLIQNQWGDRCSWAHLIHLLMNYTRRPGGGSGGTLSPASNSVTFGWLCGGAIWVTPKSSSQGFSSLSTGRFIYLFNLMLPFLHPIFFPWSLEIVFDLTVYSHQNKTKTDNSNKTKNLILTDNLAMFANSSKLLSFSWFLSQDAILDLFLLLWAV